MADTHVRVEATGVEENNTEYTDKEQMLHLFQVGSGLEPDEDVAVSAVELLEEAKITKGWQLRKLTDKLLEKLISPDEHLQEYLLASEVRDKLAKWSEEPAHAPAQSASSSSGFAMMAEALNSLREENAKQREETAKARKQRKRNRSSDSEDELKSDYNCTESLEKYKLFGIPNTHMTKERIWSRTLKRHRQPINSATASS
jgi:hypothetical protein